MRITSIVHACVDVSYIPETHILEIQCQITVFIQILATATINFSLAGVWLLIEGGSYLRAAFINLERHLLVILTRQTRFSGLNFEYSR